MIKTAMPKQFDDKTKWLDWKPTFIAFLRTQPGRHGVPLDYVVRDNENRTTTTSVDFLYDYVNGTSLTSNTFSIDSSKVHSFLIRLISDNAVAEQKVLPHKDPCNSRTSYFA